MRLRLFDRIRRLAHSRRPPADAAGVSGAQGRHRRGRRHGTTTAPRSVDFPGDPGFPGSDGTWLAAMPPKRPGNGLRRAACPANWRTPPHPGRAVPPVPEAPVVPGAQVAPGDPAGLLADPRVSGLCRNAEAPPMRAGRAKARIREAPHDAPVGLGEANAPVPAAPGPTTRWHETAEPGLAQSSEASLSDTRAAELARVAAGVPRQPDGTGRSSWRPGGSASHAGLPFRLRIPGNGRWPRTAAGIAARSRPSCGGSGTRRRRRPGKWWRPSTGWPNFPSGLRKGWPTASTRSSSAPAASRNSMR